MKTRMKTRGTRCSFTPSSTESHRRNRSESARTIITINRADRWPGGSGASRLPRACHRAVRETVIVSRARARAAN
jgi:hypothetical protein